MAADRRVRKRRRHGACVCVCVCWRVTEQETRIIANLSIAARPRHWGQMESTLMQPLLFDLTMMREAANRSNRRTHRQHPFPSPPLLCWQAHVRVEKVITTLTGSINKLPCHFIATLKCHLGHKFKKRAGQTSSSWAAAGLSLIPCTEEGTKS